MKSFFASYETVKEERKFDKEELNWISKKVIHVFLSKYKRKFIGEQFLKYVVSQTEFTVLYLGLY